MGMSVLLIFYVPILLSSLLVTFTYYGQDGGQTCGAGLAGLLPALRGLCWRWMALPHGSSAVSRSMNSNEVWRPTLPPVVRPRQPPSWMLRARREVAVPLPPNPWWNSTSTQLPAPHYMREVNASRTPIVPQQYCLRMNSDLPPSSSPPRPSTLILSNEAPTSRITKERFTDDIRFYMCPKPTKYSTTNIYKLTTCNDNFIHDYEKTIISPRKSMNADGEFMPRLLYEFTSKEAKKSIEKRKNEELLISEKSEEKRLKLDEDLHKLTTVTTSKLFSQDKLPNVQMSQAPTKCLNNSAPTLSAHQPCSDPTSSLSSQQMQATNHQRPSPNQSLTSQSYTQSFTPGQNISGSKENMLGCSKNLASNNISQAYIGDQISNQPHQENLTKQPMIVVIQEQTPSLVCHCTEADKLPIMTHQSLRQCSINELPSIATVSQTPTSNLVQQALKSNLSILSVTSQSFEQSLQSPTAESSLSSPPITPNNVNYSQKNSPQISSNLAPAVTASTHEINHQAIELKNNISSDNILVPLKVGFSEIESKKELSNADTINQTPTGAQQFLASALIEPLTSVHQYSGVNFNESPTCGKPFEMNSGKSMMINLSPSASYVQHTSLNNYTYPTSTSSTFVEKFDNLTNATQETQFEVEPTASTQFLNNLSLYEQKSSHYLSFLARQQSNVSPIVNIQQHNQQPSTLSPFQWRRGPPSNTSMIEERQQPSNSSLGRFNQLPSTLSPFQWRRGPPSNTSMIEERQQPSNSSLGRFNQLPSTLSPFQWRRGPPSNTSVFGCNSQSNDSSGNNSGQQPSYPSQFGNNQQPSTLSPFEFSRRTNGSLTARIAPSIRSNSYASEMSSTTMSRDESTSVSDDTSSSTTNSTRRPSFRRMMLVRRGKVTKIKFVS